MKNFLISLTLCLNMFIGGLLFNKQEENHFVGKTEPAINLSEDLVLQGLDNISVFVQTDSGVGSGTVIVEKVGDKVFRFVLTAGHVLEGASEDSILIIQNQEVDGKLFAKWHSRAKVLAITKQGDYDIGILMLTSEHIKVNREVKFAVRKYEKIGERVIHVGSSAGFHNSFFFGKISRIGRLLRIDDSDCLYEQVQLGAYKGSSGGGIFTEEGLFIGMFSRASSENIGFMTPLRSIKEWAARDKFDWLFNEQPPPQEIQDKFGK